MTDLEIAHSIKIKDIKEVASKIGISDDIELYGSNMAKINKKIDNKKNGKLVLVTAINPTPYGEGKTTVAIGLNDGMRRIGKDSLLVLREPSLGPVFGIKGGATGGGYAQVVPMEDINLHFTGDFHAITSANNLISAAIDNHIYFGNELNLDEERILFKRTMDLNDRALRKVELSSRMDYFQITAASEMMSIFCLSRDLEDLKRRVGNILIGFTRDDKPVYAKSLKVEGAVAVLMKDAIKPNLVQSLEGNPVIIHGGPFANVGHGCNSIIATNLGLSISDYVITEAGFGSDLGAEKFFDIKCRKDNISPDCIVIVATVRALKHHDISGNDSLKEGLSNLKVHIENMLKYSSHVIVTLNKYDDDTDEEIDMISNFVQNMNVEFSLNDVYHDGGKGAIDLANKVSLMCDRDNDFHLLYDNDISIQDKIEMVAHEIYHAKDIVYGDGVLEKLKLFEDLGCREYPVCIAKTQYSIGDNPKMLGYPRDYEVTVRDVSVSNGSEFIIVYLGNIVTMPGLGRHSNYENIDIKPDGEIVGLF